MGFLSIINVLCFLKIFRYLDTIVIKHINNILDLVGLHAKNRHKDKDKEDKKIIIRIRKIKIRIRKIKIRIRIRKIRR
jgi:hypothetical protein